LTGYITEGQITLSRELHRKGIYPPVDVLPSLSRLMNMGIGKGKTRDDHKQVSDQCYAFYAEGRDLRGLVAIVGEEALSEKDKRVLKFAEGFEDKFTRQSRREDRSIEDSLKVGWNLLSPIPADELGRISKDTKEKYYATKGASVKGEEFGVPVGAKKEEKHAEAKKPETKAAAKAPSKPKAKTAKKKR